MSFAIKDLRHWAAAVLGLSLLPGAAAAENMANKQPVGAVTNAPVESFNPWGSEPPATLNLWAGGLPTEEQARRNTPCGNCDTEWCNTNYGLGYERFPLPQWTDLPRWYAGADALFLTRDNTENITFATTGRQGVEAISTEDLDYELRPGLRAVVGRTLTNNFRVEGVYLGQHNWDDSVTVRNLNTNSLGGVGNFFSPFTGFGNPAVTGLDFNNRVTLDSTAELDSAEVNVRYRGPNRCGAWELQVLCGARYLRVDESFGYFSESSAPTPLGTTNDLDVQTSNDLIGGQIGGSIIYRASPRWWINFDGKAGVYGNSARQSTVYAFTNANGGTTTITGEAQQGATAFVGDIKVESCFQLLPRLTIVAGYNLFGIDGLATGTNNLQRDYTILTLGPAEVDHNGTVFYHGPHTGFVWAW